MMPRYAWETVGCRLIFGGCAWGGVGGKASRGWPPAEPKFGRDNWEPGRGTVTCENKMTYLLFFLKIIC